MTGNAAARHGSIVIVVAVLERAHVELAGGRAACAGRAGMPLITMPHVPQIPSRQSWSNAIGSSPCSIKPFVDDVEHLEERHVGADAVGRVGDETALVGRVRLPPDVQREVHGYL